MVDISVNNLTKFFVIGENLLQGLSFDIQEGECVAILGRNGCGKTTLMKIIAGKILPDEGTVTVGQTIQIGYYSQMMEDAQAKMNPEQRVIDYVKDGAEYIQTTEGPVSASQMLERFLFPRDAQYAPLGNLSGGEKRRLNLLRVLMEAPNVLLLDEPTNDLDVTTLTVLEDFLDYFQGIVIAVSHDRYFLDRVVSRIFAFQPGGTLRQFEGGYTDYELTLEAEGNVNPLFQMNAPAGNSEEEKKANKEEWKKQNQANKKLKFTYMEQREYETIEADIAALEEKLEFLDAEMVKYARDYGKLNHITKQKEETAEALEAKMDRWMYLEELAAKIARQ